MGGPLVDLGLARIVPNPIAIRLHPGDGDWPTELVINSCSGRRAATKVVASDRVVGARWRAGIECQPRVPYRHPAAQTAILKSATVCSGDRRGRFAAVAAAGRPALSHGRCTPVCAT